VTDIGTPVRELDVPAPVDVPAPAVELPAPAPEPSRVEEPEKVGV
jgi:hypothetical protein